MGSGFESSGRQKEKKGGEEGRKEESGESFFFFFLFFPRKTRGDAVETSPGKIRGSRGRSRGRGKFCLKGGGAGDLSRGYLR